MEKKVLLFILVLPLVFILPLIFAAQEDVDNAYACLEDKIDEKTCDKLSTSEKIFSALATGRCKSALSAEADSEDCWPDGNCNIKTTAQALLALDDSATRDWLLNQNGTPSEITWYLQVEPEAKSKCTITYDEDDYSFEITEDKKIDSAAGSCLALTSSQYWFEISSSCSGKEFEISCDESFISSLLFRSDASPTIHVSEKTSSASGGGTTTEEVNSFCFIQGGTCDYEGSLWAALVLDSIEEDISAYLPYLITMAGENENVFSEVFLYALTGYENFRYEIISQQSSNGYWSNSGDKYYDTALALYPFVYEEFIEKEEARKWLMEQQENEGCWNSGNILDTAFILHSIFPKTTSGGGVDVTESCTTLGNYCMSAASCDDSEGSVLDYECSSYYVCCDTQKVQETCEEAGGKICATGKECTGDTLEYYDTYNCCFDECEEPEETEEYTCELSSGFCEDYECGEGYKQNYEYECEYYGDICCVPELEPIGRISPLLWLLIILITLVILGIVFRNKLKEFWFRINSKSKKFKPRRPDFGFPHVSTAPRRRVMSRRVMPDSHRPAPRPAPKSPPRHNSELDDVLKKLKDMGK